MRAHIPREAGSNRVVRARIALAPKLENSSSMSIQTGFNKKKARRNDVLVAIVRALRIAPVVPRRCRMAPKLIPPRPSTTHGWEPIPEPPPLTRVKDSSNANPNKSHNTPQCTPSNPQEEASESSYDGRCRLDPICGLALSSSSSYSGSSSSYISSSSSPSGPSEAHSAFSAGS